MKDKFINNSNKLSVADFLKHFNFETINTKNIKKIYITSPKIARINISYVLNNSFDEYDKEVIYFGSPELEYFESLNENKFKSMIFSINKMKPPLVVLSNYFDKNNIKKIKKYLNRNIPLVHCKDSTQNFYLSVSSYLIKSLSKTKIIHGTLINIYGIGVLIVGLSGIGKSEAAMELIKKGHLFVADDAVMVTKFGDLLFGKPTEISQHFIEVRGLGIVDVSMMFGYQVIMQETKIDLVINLKSMNENGKISFERLGTKNNYYEIGDETKLPCYFLPVGVGKNSSDLIEDAVIDFKLKQFNQNSAKKFLENYNKVLRKKGKDAF